MDANTFPLVSAPSGWLFDFQRLGDGLSLDLYVGLLDRQVNHTQGLGPESHAEIALFCFWLDPRRFCNWRLMELDKYYYPKTDVQFLALINCE